MKSNVIASATLFALALVLTSFASNVEAGLFNRGVQPAPAPELLQVTHLEGRMDGFMNMYDPSCCQPVVVAKPCCPPPPIKQTLTFCHPCTCCNVCVDVCIPGCCTGCPEKCFKRTLLGCGKWVYTWCCGHEVHVKFHKHGGVSVRQFDR